MTKDDKILLTARYVDGDMDASEQQLYEVRLESEPDLREHFEDYQKANQTFRSHFPLNAPTQTFFSSAAFSSNKAQLEEADAFPFKSILFWFLSIAVVIVSVFLIWAPWNINLYRNYAFYEAIPMPENFKGDSVKMQKAVILYNNGSYVLANNLLAIQCENNPSNAELAYAYGNAQIETNHLSEGRETLKMVSGGNSGFKYFADFSIALSFVREDDLENAKKWLKKIPKASKSYSVAAELLGKL